jgi:hypothetical protein
MSSRKRPAAQSGDPTSPPVAFFVNVDDPSLESWYGPTVKRALLAAVLAADQDRRALFQTYSGNLLPLTYRIVNVEVNSSEMADGRFVDDFSARFALLCELCDAASEGWCTLDQIQAPWVLYSRSIYIILASAMSESVRQDVDRKLSELSWYLGAMEVDRGNPIQRWLFGESLIPTWFYSNGWVGLDEEEDAEPPARLFRGIKADGFGWTGSRSELLPPPPIAWGAMSIRGERSASVLKAASRRTHHEQIAAQVFEIFLQSTIKRPLAFRADHPKPDADLLRRKLCEYVLSPEKSTGKAELFRRALQIEKDDWRFLAAQLVAGLASAQPHRLRDEPFGERQHLQYDVTVPVVGRNGETKPVKVVWKIVDDKPPELVTAYLDAPKVLSELADHDVHTVISKPGTSLYYEELWEKATQAANQALSGCIPTPIVIQDKSGVMHTIREGMYGGAWVRVPDARTGFARWLINTGRAQKGWPGARVSAPSMNADPARAWADALAEVFRINGQDCSTGYYLD